ncbi:MAG: nadC [Gammaproteobacteria bacterium]|jgi:nicotinate-nucleotide pyrophosphorylase (carboxylating)|nr:nadC [Gammaproteobacteria bacterium]
MTLSSWQLNSIDSSLIELALKEDLGHPFRDMTTATLFPELERARATAKIISKHPEPIVFCGLPLIKAILNQLTPDYQLQVLIHDGDTVAPGETLFNIEGSANALLMAERTILNFIQRLSAVASLTKKFVDAVHGTTMKILDTRKTTPGFRHLEKYAVQCGGGVNHRMGLYDALMVKDTHIDALGGMSQALQRLPENITEKYPVIIEVRTQDELNIVLEKAPHKVSRVLLDNMSLEEMAKCVKLCQNIMPTEASGNMSLNTIRAVAETGVDFASVGKLTHSAGSVDLSMKTI